MVGNLRPAGRIGLPRHFFRPATFFLFSMIDIQQHTGEMILSLFFGLRHQSSEIRPEFLAKTFFFLSLPSIWPKKGLNFWRRPFFFDSRKWWRPAGTLLVLNVAHWFKRLPTPDLGYSLTRLGTKKLFYSIKRMDLQ